MQLIEDQTSDKATIWDESPSLWRASEPRRFDFRSPLSTFLQNLMKEQKLTIREACEIAGCSPSVLHGWIHGSYPTDTVIHLKTLCNHFGFSLAEALTGSPDQTVMTKQHLRFPCPH